MPEELAIPAAEPNPTHEPPKRAVVPSAAVVPSPDAAQLIDAVAPPVAAAAVPVDVVVRESVVDAAALAALDDAAVVLVRVASLVAHSARAIYPVRSGQEHQHHCSPYPYPSLEEVDCHQHLQDDQDELSRSSRPPPPRDL